MSEADRFVAVAVPAPLIEPLSYRVPRGLGDAVAPGVRVRVPLGRRRVIGVVLGEAGPPPEGVEARELLATLDEPDAPALPRDLLETLSWAADYYLAPPGEAVRAALPAALGPKRGAAPEEAPRGAPRMIALVAPAPHVRAEPEAALGLLSRAPARRRALEEALAEDAPIARALLARRAKTNAASVRTLVEAGLLVASERPEEVAPLPEAELPSERPEALTEEQERAVAAIVAKLDEGVFAPHVLYGVTGSGKTEVYLRAAEAARARGRGVLFLVPEIGLTPQVTRALHARFGEGVSVLHSGMSDRQRFEHWQRAREGRASIVVGARSALFAPVPEPGLIVVDEEHDAGYKQEDAPRYHARDLALVRARSARAVALLGSATPSMESWSLAAEGRANLLTLPRRVGDRPLASVELVDMREEFRRTKRADPLSRRLVEALDDTLARGEQAMVLINRRGFARSILCRFCGEPIGCSACSVAMTWHKVGAVLRCHYCGTRRGRPASCPACGSEHLHEMGSGTQQIEERLALALPEARLARVDRDTVRSAARLAETLSRFARGELDLLVGTQMIAKGHHFPNVTLVGVLSADASLGMPDFRAAERCFQLVTQVAGRAGRGQRAGHVIVQAFQREHPALVAAVAQDFEAFAERELPSRRALHYPPGSALVNLVVRDRERTRALERAAELARRLREAGEGHVAVMGPTDAPLARLREEWRVQVVGRARRRGRLRDALKSALRGMIGESGVMPRWLVVDVDPQQLL